MGGVADNIFFLVKNPCFHFWHPGKWLRSVGRGNRTPLTLCADSIVDIHVCKTSFVISFVIYAFLFLFYALHSTTEISPAVLNGTNKKVHLCLSPDLRGESIVLHN